MSGAQTHDRNSTLPLASATPAALSGQHEIFLPAKRINRSFTASVEGRALRWMAERSPRWVTSDRLTALGLAAQVGAGASYALARYDRRVLLCSVMCVALNWLGDSMDGTLARVRDQQRPRFGFYVDHVVDLFGATALMAGLGSSGLLHWPVALAVLIGFLLLSSESYLATYTLGAFELSQGIFGPTELRILLILGTLAAWRNPYAHVLGHKWLLFDIGGVVASICMFALVVVLGIRHTKQLHREEPLL